MMSQSSDASSNYPTSVGFQQPTLSLLNSLLTSATNALERAAEEKSLLLNKVKIENYCLYLCCALVYIVRYLILILIYK
jgi:nuclear pore complex protein Nup205